MKCQSPSNLPQNCQQVSNVWHERSSKTTNHDLIMAYTHVGMTLKKMAATLKVHKWHARNVCIRSVKGFHQPYQTLPSASMANRTITFAGEYHSSTRPASHQNWQIVYLLTSFFLSFFLSLFLSHASTISVEAIKTIQAQKKWHKSLGTLLTIYRDHSTQTILQWFSSTLMLYLVLLRHFVWTKLFVACTPLAGSSAEHVFYTYSLSWRRQLPSPRLVE